MQIDNPFLPGVKTQVDSAIPDIDRVLNPYHVYPPDTEPSYQLLGMSGKESPSAQMDTKAFG